MSQERTPFQFLAGCHDDLIEEVHRCILNPCLKGKYTLVSTFLSGDTSRNFDNWIYKKRKELPMEALFDMCPRCLTEIIRLLKEEKWEALPMVFRDLDTKPREILVKWYEENSDKSKLEERMLKKAREILISFNNNKKKSRCDSPSPTPGTEKQITTQLEGMNLGSSLGHQKRRYPYDRNFIQLGTFGQYGENLEPSDNTGGIECVSAAKRPALGNDEVTKTCEQNSPEDLQDGASKHMDDNSTSTIMTSTSSSINNSPNNIKVEDIVRNEPATEDRNPTIKVLNSDDVFTAKQGEQEEKKPATLPAVERPAQTAQENQDHVAEIPTTENVCNILLLGETGVGKTTFINSLANYVKSESLDKALEKPVILIETSFTVTGKNLKQSKITVKANCCEGEEPLIHTITWNEEDISKTLRIIDTPGVNDTRGTSQDEANFDKIIALIKKIGNLSAICILLKPNESRLTQGFRDCLNNILVKLHRSVTKNILFCFTNTRSTMYRPGDTIAILSNYLEELEKTAGITIKANKHNIFCFDNDCFRYMCVLMKEPGARGANTHATLSAGWVHNVQQVKSLFQKIQGMVIHKVEDTVNINKTRGLLVGLARPLTEIAQILQENKRSLEVTIREKVIYKVPLAKPKTVCTFRECNNYVKGENGQVQPVPKIICHDDCKLPILKDGEGPNNLNECAAFDLTTGKCWYCKCHWTIHKRLTYKTVTKLESVATAEDKKAFMTCKDSKQRTEKILEYFNHQKDNVQHEYDLIKEACYEFSAFLKYNTVKTGIDPYFDYLNREINIEENKVKYGGNKLSAMDLKLMLNEYTNGVNLIMEEIKEQRRPPPNSEELQKKIENLRKMKINGAFIASAVDALNNEQ